MRLEVAARRCRGRGRLVLTFIPEGSAVPIMASARELEKFATIENQLAKFSTRLPSELSPVVERRHDVAAKDILVVSGCR